MCFIRIISFNFLNLETDFCDLELHPWFRYIWSWLPERLLLTFWAVLVIIILAFHQFHQHASSSWLRAFVYAILTVWNVPLYPLPSTPNSNQFSSKLFLKHLLSDFSFTALFSGFPYPQIQVRSNYFMMLLTLCTFVSKIISVIHIWCLCVYLGQVISPLGCTLWPWEPCLGFNLCIYLILIIIILLALSTLYSI